MPKGIYIRTSEMKTGKHMLGRKHSEKTKKKMSLTRKKYNISPKTKRKISNSLKGTKHTDLRRKNISKAHKGLHSSPKTEFKKGQYSGKNHFNWKGGITPLWKRIRGLIEYQNWVKKVFKQDDYTCQECFKRGGNLEAHHNKKSFSVILQEFLQTYNQFSPIEDKETLIRLAISYQPFWDLNNGQTLCEDCHKKVAKNGSIRFDISKNATNSV